MMIIIIEQTRARKSGSKTGSGKRATASEPAYTTWQAILEEAAPPVPSRWPNLMIRFCGCVPH
ncbi:MAG TPA: hypothetical protein P5186_05140 [Candidatus Paceibacterota bacterium]|nr:hypothetical protein [Verrucomicrobiota bacterium]HRY47413.1 hypothetical protein [Candidatus Paceibacterota bacterium]HSA00472.1 hypothetical protein [Candidatus Paceibacterota bacterium]